MKRLLTTLFIFSVFCLFGLCRTVDAGNHDIDLRIADSYTTSSYYSLPPHVTRHLDSHTGMGSYDPIESRYSDCGGCYGHRSLRWWERVRLYGWIEAGMYFNADGNRSRHEHALGRDGKSERYQIPNTGNSTQLGNVRSTDPMLNQLWLGLERKLDTRRGFDWGFQVDFLFGTDGWMSQSYGDATFDYRNHSRDYYVSLPQLYASLGYKRWSVKIGKFETMLGFEHLQANRSFFYSHSNLFYTEPQTHSGVQFEYRCSDKLWFTFGYVQGADGSFENRFDDHGFLGGVYWRPVSTVTLWYTVYAADLGNGQYRNGEDRYGGTIFQHTFVANWKVSDRWDYSFQWNLGDRDGKGRNPDATFFATAHYLTYRINCRWRLGLRFDQVHANQWMRNSGFSRPQTGEFIGDLYSVTLGANWQPFRRINVRPEIRYDYAEDCRPYDRGRSRGQFSGGLGIVYLF